MQNGEGITMYGTSKSSCPRRLRCFCTSLYHIFIMASIFVFSDTRVFISVAADLVFSDLKEPVRIVKESKVKVFQTNEKFWNPSKPRLHEEYIMELKEVSWQKYRVWESLSKAQKWMYFQCRKFGRN